jgi:hypothetical protein
MQEDNWSKRLADSLRKQQEDSPLPYEPGAWEAFEKRRKKGVVLSPIYYWISGIAASIALIVALGYGLLSPTMEEQKNPSETLVTQAEPEPVPTQAEDEPSTSAIDSRPSETLAEASGSQGSFYLKKLPTAKVTARLSQTEMNAGAATAFALEVISSENKAASVTEQATPPLLALEEKVVLPESDPKSTETKSEVVTMTEEEAKAKLMAQLTEGVDEEQEQVKKASAVVLGFGPGFGNSSQNNVATSGSNLGVGVAYDLPIGQKLALGSGVGLNYLNQSSQSQNYAQVAGFSSAVKETQQVQQVQVDIPLYVRYPVTRNNSISLQAGFSNLITFNQQAEQVVSFTRQVSVADAANVSANASTLKTEQLTLASDLIVPSQRFFPLATANLGVNIRVYESSKTSYLVMPFYNYPIQDITGTGQNPGVVGAAFKVRFGAIKK